MMSEAWQWLASPEGQHEAQQHLGEDPAAFALRYAGPHRAALASQIRAMQKARNKLPSWYAARCLLPARALEQCSSEAAAEMRLALCNGTSCLDLTAGLGVDSVALSRRFERVTAIEADPELAAITRHNLQLLGIQNIGLLNQKAEDFVQAYDGPAFDLIYVDPDRRDESGRRRLRFEDCAPDVLGMMPKLRRIGRALWVKSSPLFDVAEAERLPGVAWVAAISVEGECKELLIAFEEVDAGKQKVWCWHKGKISRFDFSAGAPAGDVSAVLVPEAGGFLLEPDAAFYKMRLLPALFAAYFPNLKGALNAADGFFFAAQAPKDFPGRVFQIQAVHAFDPKALKQRFGKQRLHILQRHFPLSVAQIRQQTRIAEGGGHYLICTTAAGRRIAIEAAPFAG